MNGLQGKNVLVTGGTSGIGQAIAIRFAKEGCNVAINYRSNLEGAERTHALIHDHEGFSLADRTEEMGVKHIPIQADVSKEEEILEMFSTVKKEMGLVDILVNNAGFQIPGDSHEISIDTFDRVLATNLRGAYICARESIKHMLEAGKPGVIINISSVHQEIPKPRFIGYSVSKGGMQNLTRTLALEYAGRGIRVNAIGPGATVTPINRAWIDDPEKRAMVESHIPMGRAGTSEEMAGVTVFLASDDAAYITGQTIFVDGGLTLYPDFRTAWSSE
jgi:glucose 1-dehydrogenase